MFIDRREHLLNMKNKYLTKCLCVTMAAALSLAGPAGVLAADGTSLSVTEAAIQSDETAQETAAAKATVPTQVPTAAPTQTPTAAPTRCLQRARRSSRSICPGTGRSYSDAAAF